WYEVEELKEMKSLTINFTETFEKLTSTTKDINIEKVGTRSRKTKKTISKNNIIRSTADGDNIDTIHNIQESNNSKKETDIKEDNNEIISNTSNDNGAALFIQEQEDENNYTEDSIGNKQETKENILKESDIQKDSRNKAEDNGIYINIMKIMLEGNKISLPIDIFNSLEKGPIYPIFSDFNTGNRVAIVDIYVDKAEKYKKITACMTAKNSCRYIDIEILKEYNSSELPIGFKDDFKRDYLKWYKSTLHVRL
ncbi:MAG: hypothetical protein J6A59_08165, partial [Lachnospiraceae bacterium]|nr:hypothetical protein [Lachnospiraceae bacterium]